MKNENVCFSVKNGKLGMQEMINFRCSTKRQSFREINL